MVPARNIELVQTEFLMPKLKRIIIFIVTVIFVIAFLTIQRSFWEKGVSVED